MLDACHRYRRAGAHVPADVLVPSAPEDAISVDNAEGVRASVIVEAAKRPTTPDASEILHQRGVLVVPDILANAGGVTVSYFEWAQNIQQFRRELDRVVDELEKTMVRAYAGGHDEAERCSVDPHTGAFAVGIRRAARAATPRNALWESIDIN